MRSLSIAASCLLAATMLVGCGKKDEDASVSSSVYACLSPNQDGLQYYYSRTNVSCKETKSGKSKSYSYELSTCWARGDMTYEGDRVVKVDSGDEVKQKPIGCTAPLTMVTEDGSATFKGTFTLTDSGNRTADVKVTSDSPDYPETGVAVFCSESQSPIGDDKKDCDDVASAAGIAWD